MHGDLTQGSIRAGLIRFSLPLIAGNLLQQLYNVADTLIVGRFLGNVALAAVGSAFSLMILLTSLVLGLCMGSGVVFSQLYGEGNMDKLKTAMTNAFCLIAALSLLLTVLSYALLDAFIVLLRVPPEAVPDITSYLRVIFAGIFFTFLYNFFAAALRSVGNSLASLLFLLLSTVVNIALDLLFVLVLHQGVAGAALATVIAQGISAAGIALYFLFRLPELRPCRSNFRLDRPAAFPHRERQRADERAAIHYEFRHSARAEPRQQLRRRDVAAFAAGVKIDSFAYSPAQDFANGFATFVAQNTGAGKPERVKQGIREAALLSLSFCAVVSALVFVFARPLLRCSSVGEGEILAVGVHYLRVEGVFYVGIGLLFLLYAIYRGLEQAGMSVVLTVISLGLRVALAYAFAPRFGVTAIWLAIPIGWFIADAVGLIRLKAALPHLIKKRPAADQTIRQKAILPRKGRIAFLGLSKGSRMYASAPSLPGHFCPWRQHRWRLNSAGFRRDAVLPPRRAARLSSGRLPAGFPLRRPDKGP